ncbi:MAG: HmuY family protein [Polaribacter sp.]|uniref:HmuY family protein n=1 Tax=Polaribacter sp. TaxID=1920175 RepID=UPI003266267D
MKKLQILFLFSIAIISSCSTDPVFFEDPFVVAFKETSGKLLEIENKKEIQLIYSEAAYEDSVVKINITTENALYGRDFVTIPEAVNNELSLSISVDESENNFQIVELNDSFTDAMRITFSIISIEVENSNIQGNTTHELSDNAYLGGTFLPTVGGPNEPNQVYIDLSSNKETFVKRDSWDLGFYGGDEFRVTINGSLYMAIAPLTTTDINSVNSASVSSLQSLVAVGTFNPDNEAYVDAPNGNILETAIQEISEDNSLNPVYLVNLGVEVGTAKPTTGSAAIAGAPRGWKKIRILRNDEGYKLQYADLDATSYNEVTITKDTDFNFSFFSFNKEETVNVEPQKTQWDICFTVFTNILEGAGSYGFSDFIIHNRKGGVSSYSLEGNNISYENFSSLNIDESLLKDSQTIIGSSWRNVFDGTVTANIFYVLKDANNNYYKIRFLDLVNDSGERGHPRFEYKLLQ